MCPDERLDSQFLAYFFEESPVAGNAGGLNKDFTDNCDVSGPRYSAVRSAHGKLVKRSDGSSATVRI